MNRHGNSTNYYSDWHTPDLIIDKVKLFFGGTIDLDPCTDNIAQERIQAKSYFTKDDNGLTKDWFGNVYLNYPGKTKGYKNSSNIWINKAIEEHHKQNTINTVICLFSIDHLNINPVLLHYPICFLRNRISFIKPDSKNRPSHANALVLITSSLSKEYEFANIFARLGTTIKGKVL